MKKGLKKLLATVLSTAMVASMAVTAFAATSSDVANTKYEEPAQTLAALSIMVGDKDTGLFRPEDSIKRSEVAKIAVNAMGLESVALSSTQATKYPDVVSNHWANGYINVATAQGLVIGYTDGSFRPDDTITYAEAMTIMVRVIGHEPSALARGGYPNGFLVVGAENSINKNTTGGSNDKASRGTVAFMAFNTLTVKLMEQVGFGPNASYEVVDKTVLKNKLGVDKLTGQVSGIENTRITGNSTLRNGEIEIGGEVYKTSENFNGLLGYNVVYYVKDNANGEAEVILARPEESKNSSLDITAEQFSAIATDINGNKVIKYWEKDTDTKETEAKLSATPTIIYNNKFENLDYSMLDLTDKSGTINLLDTNKDGKYDIVFVTEHQNIVVEDTMPTSYKVIDMYGNPTLTLDPSDENIKFTLTKAHQAISIAELKKWDVLSVAKSKDGSVIDVTVTNNPINGTVTGIDADGKVTIDNKDYEVAKNYTTKINLSDTGTFYLDADGKIAAVDSTGTISSNYSYLLNAAVNNVIDNTLQVQVFTKEGKTEIYPVATKVNLNGVSGKTATDVLNALKVAGNVNPQLITFELNTDGKISTISTAINNSTTGVIDTENFTMNKVLSDAVYNLTTGKLGNVNIDKNTIIFDIPAGKTDSADFAIINSTALENDAKYDGYVFDMGEDYTAKTLILTNSNAQANAEAPIAVVNSIRQALNANGDTVDKLMAMVNGKETELFANATGVLVKGTNQPLAKGDVVQYKTNSSNEITDVRVLFNIDNKATEALTTPVENLQIAYGQVANKFTNSINLSVNGNIMNLSLNNNIPVYSIDTTANNSTVKLATIADIQRFDSTENSRVLVKIYKDVVQEVVIIK